MHLVRRVHFRSRDKDGGNTIGSAILGIPMLHANLMALSFKEPKLWETEVYIRVMGIFDLFTRDLDLDPITFIYELDPYCVKL